MTFSSAGKSSSANSPIPLLVQVR